MHKKKRLDILLVERGIAPSIDKARSYIMAGQVIVGDHLVDKSGQQIDVEKEIRLKDQPLQYVSRGGIKLRKALDEFAIDVTGLLAIDVGASTGGFTDCLLQSGAEKVIAVDVGYGQLAWKLQQDVRVVCMERTNIRYLKPEHIAAEPSLAVIDASFISLEKVLPATIGLLKKKGRIIALIKPQFEVARGEIEKGGIVRNAVLHDKVIDDVCMMAIKMGLAVFGVCESPITGADGNKEFLILLQKSE